MISKELLSKVLGHGFCAITELTQSVDGKYISWSTYEEPRPHDWKQLNIHELSHKCKEWALTEDYILKTHNLKSHSICTVIRIIEESPYIDTIGIYNLPTEPEAVFKACEWLLEQKATS